MDAPATVRSYTEADLPQMTAIWNRVVADGVAFPQEQELDPDAARTFFASQSHCGVAVDPESGEVLGLYILHPNNVGRCGHIANASYAVSTRSRGRHVGEKLVRDSIEQCPRLGFSGLQFNAVVDSNHAARHLYERIGFTRMCRIPNGFHLGNGVYEDTHIYFIETPAS